MGSACFEHVGAAEEKVEGVEAPPEQPDVCHLLLGPGHGLVQANLRSTVSVLEGAYLELQAPKPVELAGLEEAKEPERDPASNLRSDVSWMLDRVRHLETELLKPCWSPPLPRDHSGSLPSWRCRKSPSSRPTPRQYKLSTGEALPST